MILIDTSVIYALLDGRDARHQESVEWYRGYDGELATTPLVLAEVDHLASSRAGSAATAAFRRDLASGAYVVEWWPEAVEACVEIADQYADLGLGLCDASLVTLAARIETTMIATFNQRRFRTVLPLAGGPAFILVPVDRP